MSARVNLPSSVSGATLGRSGEGVTVSGLSPQSPNVGFSRPPTVNSPVSPIPMQQFQTSVAVPSPVSVNQASPPPMMMDMGENGEMMGEEAGEKPAWGYKFKAMSVIGAILIFIIVWVLLFTGKFNIVTDLTNDQRVINTRKLLIWTIIIGAIINIVVFGGIFMYRRRKTA